ncbi:MAG TPA: aminodeoxychorismate synthase component I [Limnochordia bacterium]|nr:aminodeoxychorismate synthase component I [Limnochordia bacterium]
MTGGAAGGRNPRAPGAGPPAAPWALIEFPDEQGRPASLAFTDPADLAVAYTLDEVRPALAKAAAFVQKTGGCAAGYVAYEAAGAFDPALVTHPPGSWPLVWFGLFERPADAAGSCAWPAPGMVEPLAWRANTSEDEYRRAIDAVRAAIAAGETYQVNYTVRLRAPFAGDAFAAYQRLRSNQCGRYAAFLDLGRYQIASASPELFFERRGERLTARPMKGTCGRGRTLEEDLAQARALQHSAKNRAENVMIVDLLRNDVGRIAQIGSVRVPELCAIERYPTLLQMTSTIRARLRPGVELPEIFAALFPCGSITGAPKVNTMRWIARLERAPRGVYCGAVGLITPKRTVFNVAIRTLVVDREAGAAEYGTGGGIVWDSEAAGEYAEARLKAAVLTERPPFALLESLRLEDGRYARLEGHLERLRRSAAYFGRRCPLPAVRAVLAEHARAHASGVRKVRLLLDRGGELKVESAPLGPPAAGPLPVAWAATPVDSRDVFLFHKTTHRLAYERRKAERPDAFDVLLWNEAGEATEFSIGNLVVELDGALVTPPVGCGLLAGVMRATLLAAGEVQERRLSVADVHRAGRLWLINSVRGWVRVELAAPRTDPAGPIPGE